MFKQFAIAMLAMATMTTARKLRCDSEDGTCMQVTRDTADGQCIPIFQGEHVQMQLSGNELRGTRKEGHRGRCYWRLQVPCPDNPENLIPLEEDSYDFGEYVVSKVGKCKQSKFEIEIKEDAAVDASHALSFINSCDVRPDDGEEDEDSNVADEDEDEDIDDEDEAEYDDPICKEINIMVLKQMDDDEMDQ